MAEEIRALEENHTYTIEHLPPSKKLISCKWVYRVKYKSDGSLERYKARLVIRGDHWSRALTKMRLSLLLQKWLVFGCSSLS